MLQRHSGRRALAPIASRCAATLALTASVCVHAAPSLGGAADFAVLGLEGGQVTINSATSITGNVGYSAGVVSLTNQKVDSFVGAAYVASSADFHDTPATFAPSGGILYGATVDAKLAQANHDALDASSAIGALAPTFALGALGDDDSRVVNSSGALNVVSLQSLNYNSDTLSFVGRSGFDDSFMVNVAGDFNFSQSRILLNNVSVDHLIFNFTSASHIDINKSNTLFQGTILAPLGTVIYHNPASFTGRILAKDITLHSDFNIAAPSPSPVPEPATGLLLACGLLGVFLAARASRPQADRR